MARCPPCSLTAHDQNVLGQCAQSRATLATPLNGGRGNWNIFVDARSERPIRAAPSVGNYLAESIMSLIRISLNLNSCSGYSGKNCHTGYSS